MAKEPRCEVPLPLSTNWLQSMNGKYTVLMRPGSFLVAPSAPGTQPFLSVFFPSRGLGRLGEAGGWPSETFIFRHTDTCDRSDLKIRTSGFLSFLSFTLILAGSTLWTPLPARKITVQWREGRGGRTPGPLPQHFLPAHQQREQLPSGSRTTLGHRTERMDRKDGHLSSNLGGQMPETRCLPTAQPP